MMADLRTRLLPLFRRSSTVSSSKSSTSSTTSALDGGRNRSKASLLTPNSRGRSFAEPVAEEEGEREEVSTATSTTESRFASGDPQRTPDTSLETTPSLPLEKINPRVTLEEPTPVPLKQPSRVPQEIGERGDEPQDPSVAQSETDPAHGRLEAGPRRQSLAHSSQTRFIKTLLEAEKPQHLQTATDYFGGAPTLSANMLHRKIWVKRPGASATLVSINEEDLVDDVRDMILKKYANSLGRSFDAPDVTLRIVARAHSHRHAHGERTLGPEEPISRTLDAYYPGGQVVDEALVIDVPQRRTPRHSPRVPQPYYLADDIRPGESGTDYFPPMPPGASSPHLQSSLSIASSQTGSHHPSMHAISVLNTGQVPLLPSPGGRGTRHSHRPKYGRQQTSSPTVLSPTMSTQNESLKSHPNCPPPPPPPLPTPPIPSDIQRAVTPPAARASSPRPKPPTKRSKKGPSQPSLPAGLLDGSVPPINVLIVEDNIINLKLLEAFMKRLKVRWHTAMNGREAVTKWRAGGFHLVLMDIQLPVMNGLEATKEIRRLERVNNIGVFSNNASNAPPLHNMDRTDEGNGGPEGGPEGEDRLLNTGLFKSPVIIVALTASSLQSDRHEALAAGCNDFLTKPVNFVWLERKVMEWGCMQALIDFDGWRKWKDFSQTPASTTNNNNTSLSTTNVNIHNSNAGSSNTTAGAGTGMSNSTNIKESPNAKSTVAGSNHSNKVGGGGGGTLLKGVGLGERKTSMARKDKRSSWGAGVGALSGVSEDSGEMIVDSGARRDEDTSGDGGKTIVAGA